MNFKNMISSEQIIEMLLKSDALKKDHDLTADSLFADHGVDSLDIFSLLLDVQEQTEIEISDEDIDQLTSVNAIIEYMKIA